MPVGDEVVTPQEDAIQGLRRGYLSAAILGDDQPLHQVVYYRITDAGVVAAAG